MNDNLFLDLGFGFKVALREIYAIMPMHNSTSKALFRAYYRDGKVLRATAGRKANAYLMMNNGYVFATMYDTDELVSRIHELKSLSKAVNYVAN